MNASMVKAGLLIAIAVLPLCLASCSNVQSEGVTTASVARGVFDETGTIIKDGAKSIDAEYLIGTWQREDGEETVSFDGDIMRKRGVIPVHYTIETEGPSFAIVNGVTQEPFVFSLENDGTLLIDIGEVDPIRYNKISNDPSDLNYEISKLSVGEPYDGGSVQLSIDSVKWIDSLAFEGGESSSAAFPDSSDNRACLRVSCNITNKSSSAIDSRSIQALLLVDGEHYEQVSATFLNSSTIEPRTSDTLYMTCSIEAELAESIHSAELYWSFCQIENDNDDESAPVFLTQVV